MTQENLVNPDSEAGYSIWLKLFVLQFLVAFYLYETIVFKSRHDLKRETEEEKARDKKYYAFARNDLHKITRWNVYPFLAFFAPRCVISYFGIFVQAFLVLIISMTQKSDQYLGCRGYIIKKICQITARQYLFFCGVWPGLLHEEERYFDYKKYLGPDWKPTKDLPSCICTNHQSWMDIMVHMTRQPPCHVAKEATKKLPAVGWLAQALGCLFVDRGKGGGKDNLQEKINERQKDCEKGLYPPLIFYPEGGTSNGRYLQKFKRGAFMGLNSIQPILFKYDSPFFDAENCVMKMVAQGGLVFTNMWQGVKIIVLPTFKPNEYFFQNHQKEGEEKWQTYMRVIRDIMSEASGCPKCDLSLEDKLAYKLILYPKKDKYAN